MAAAIPYAIMVGGALMQQRAAQQQGDERRTQINQALARTSATQQKANTAIGAEAAKLAPAARIVNLQSQADADTNAANADLQAAGATDGTGNAIIDTAGDHGAVSKDFLTAKADRALAEGSRLTSLARQVARARAPGQLQEQEGQNRADLSEQLGDMWGSARNLNDANQATAAGIELPGYGTLGALASQLGAAYAGKGTGASAGRGTTRMLPKNAKGGVIWDGGDSTNGGFA